MRLTGRAALENATHAHTNLSMFYAIIALCEGGLFYGPRPSKALSKIIKICKSEAVKELKQLDAGRAALAQSEEKK
jgi:hypothetical protein